MYVNKITFINYLNVILLIILYYIYIYIYMIYTSKFITYNYMIFIIL